MPAEPYNVYVYLRNGRVAEVANVTAYQIISPVFMDGTYRDTPPVVGAAAAAASTYTYDPSNGPAIVTQVGPATIAGGVVPNSTGGAINIESPSSIAEDDRYRHLSPRYAFHPEALLVFTTLNGGEFTYPTASRSDSGYSPSTATGSFDAVFRWRDVKGWSNTAPQGWAV